MKTLFRLIPVVLFFVVSCTGNSYKDVSTAELAVSVDISKVRLSGESTVWSADDRLSVFWGTGENIMWTYVGEDGASSGIIRGYVPLYFDDGSGDEWVSVVYPYNVDASVSGSMLSTYIPTIQVAHKESFDNEAVLMTGRTTSSSVSLSYATSFIALNLNGEQAQIDSIVVKSVDGVKLSGPCMVDLSSNVPAAVASGSDSVTLVSDSSTIDFDGSDVSYLVSIPPGTYESGFHISVYTGGVRSVTKDEMARNLLPGHVHSVDVYVQPEENDFYMKIPFLCDGHGYSPFVEVTAEEGKAKILYERSFTLSDYPQFTLDFKMDRIRLVWGKNNGLELQISAGNWIKIPSVEGKVLKSVGMVLNKSLTDVAITDVNGYETEYVRKDSLPLNMFYADLTSSCPGTPYLIMFDSAFSCFLTELVFYYSE